MKPIAIAAIGALFTSAAFAASAPAPSPSSQGSMKSQSTQSSKGANVASTQSTLNSSSTTTTTQRGPSKTGQPSQDCESLGNQPGHAMTAPGSAFNPDGTAGTKYAGEQPQNSRNIASVSQYDVACARPSK
jgi:hypothetical protein